MHTRPIRVYHRGAIVEILDATPTRSVLEWLREDLRCSGSKEGCAEGDCGACTVVLGTLGDDGALALQPVNACIQFLPLLDGKALFTVEDLQRGPDLHPVQQAMVDCHGSQCGFCTPGFVMSLWACYERHGAARTLPSRQQLADDLSGNLCRCTGYRPILDAGQRMFDAPPALLDRSVVASALRELQAEAPLHIGSRFHAPRTLTDFATLRAARPQARLLAGGTDIALWVNKQLRDLGELISIGAVAELQRVELGDDALLIGAAASLEDAWRALVRLWPGLHDVWLRFASLPIRSAGTMGGNIANGSPIGDAAPVLMALDATLLLRRGEQQRELPLADFYVDYGVNRLESGEFIQALRVPLPVEGTQLRAYKIAKRYDSDISALCAGLSITLDADRVAEARLAFGGLAATVRRAAHAEAALRGQPWNQTTVDAAKAALAQDFTPLSDLRASAAYRLQVAQNLLQRCWLETRLADPLPPAALSVWAGLPHSVP